MIRRHWIVMLFRYLKFIIFLSLAWIFYYVALRYENKFWEELIYYFFLPIIFLILNYAFIKLVLSYIKYYNNLIILHKDQIIFIKSTFLWTGNVEIIEMSKVTKIDTFCRGIIPNVIWFWTLIIEQQRDKVSEFTYVPKPYKTINYLKEVEIHLNTIITNLISGDFFYLF